MDINDLTIGQAREINALLGSGSKEASKGIDGGMMGKKVIIRTYLAGVWFGTLIEKDRNEVIMSNARRMWQWWAKEGISLSAVAVHGIRQDKSRITVPVDKVWLEAIEIIPCTEDAISLIEGADHAEVR